VLLGAGVLVVHDITGLLRHPFWTDEAWVALSTRMPLAQVPDITATTPLGFALLLRPAALLGDHVPRLVPLLFAAATVVTAAVFAGSLPWPIRQLRPFAATAAGLIALLAPTALVRNDLKQYTADAFCTMLAFAVCSRTDAALTTRRLAALVAISGCGALLSVAAAFAGLSCLAAVSIARVTRRDRTGARNAALALVASALIAGVLYQLTLRRGVTHELDVYWRPYFLDANPFDAAPAIWDRFSDRATDVGLGGAALLIIFVAGGVVTLLRLGRPAVALAFGILWLGMVVLGVLDRYPFLDLRTSHFLLVLTAVVGTIGISGAIGVLARRFAAAPAVVAVVGVALWLPLVDQSVRRLGLPDEDVRAQTVHVRDHRLPGDVILVNAAGSYGFAYYWSDDDPTIVDDASTGPGFVPQYPPGARIVVATDRDLPAVGNALVRALAAGADGSGRIWLVRSHATTAERDAWDQAIARLDLSMTTISLCSPDIRATSTPATCAEPLTVLQRAST
jgi:hypothetical protein